MSDNVTVNPNRTNGVGVSDVRYGFTQIERAVAQPRGVRGKSASTRLEVQLRGNIGISGGAVFDLLGRVNLVTAKKIRLAQLVRCRTEQASNCRYQPT